MSTIPKYLLNRKKGGSGSLTPQNLKTVGFDSLIKDPLHPVGNVEFGYQQQSQSSPGGHLYVGQQMVPMRTINGQPLVGNTDITITGEPNMVSTTYAALKDMRDNNTLVPGTWYRITDYTCTTTQAGTDSAGHQFDIVVRADTLNILNENAFAAWHETEMRFSPVDISGWRLKYSLDNDTNRFAWADPDYGKGVIYWMRDSHGNEAPYDFKNIRFARYAVGQLTGNNLTQSALESFASVFVYDSSKNPFYFGLMNTGYTQGGLQFEINDKEPPAYYYTFGGSTDESLDNPLCYGNVIKPWIDQGLLTLNNGVWVNTGGKENQSHHSTTCGTDCHDWTCGDGCDNWTCGNGCDNWTCGNGCDNWTCGNGCNHWSCCSDSSAWTCGSGCNSWTCGEKCSAWTCGSGCHDWACGNNCYSWTCGNDCYYWICGNDYMFFHVMSGTVGSSAIPADIGALMTSTTDYSQYIGFNSSGQLRMAVLFQ